MVDGGTRAVPGWRNVMVSLVIGWGMEESAFTGADQKVSFCFPKLLCLSRGIGERRPVILTFLRQAT